jgi:type VI secretion system protein ImpM
MMVFRSPPPSPPAFAPGVFAVGKCAGHAEFLRPDEGVVAQFDAWVERGMTWALERWGTAWKSALPMGVAYGFLWRAPRADASLCGIIAPSRDAIGRDYPLAVLSPVAHAVIARAPHVVPLAFGGFLDSAYDTVVEARVAPWSPRDLAAQMAMLVTGGPDDVLRAEAEYASWTYETRLDTAWAAVFPEQDPITAVARTLDALSAALVPLRGREDPETPLVLRLPLGHGGAAAAAVWIDVVRRLARWSRTIPSAFWAVDEGALLIAPGVVSPSVLAEMWRADPSSDVVYEAATVDSQHIPPSGFRELPSAVRAGAGVTSMRAFLDSLGS